SPCSNLQWLLVTGPPARASFPFKDTATSEVSTLSLHDALPIYGAGGGVRASARRLTTQAGWSSQLTAAARRRLCYSNSVCTTGRSEEHTSELQSREKLVCRPLLEKKK